MRVLITGITGFVGLCSGRDYATHQMLEMLLQRTSLRVDIRVDAARLRPSDVPRPRGSGEQFVRQTGWRREIDFPKTLEDLLDYWRAKVRSLSADAGLSSAPAMLVGEPLESI